MAVLLFIDNEAVHYVMYHCAEMSCWAEAGMAYTSPRGTWGEATLLLSLCHPWVTTPVIELSFFSPSGGVIFFGCPVSVFQPLLALMEIHILHPSEGKGDTIG